MAEGLTVRPYLRTDPMENLLPKGRKVCKSQRIGKLKACSNNALDGATNIYSKSWPKLQPFGRDRDAVMDTPGSFIKVRIEQAGGPIEWTGSRHRMRA